MKTSVIIPNYNYAEFLPFTIDSLLTQSEPVDEIIVVDDGSTDNSRAVIESYGDKVIGVFQDNQGQASAINNGFAHSGGDIIFILDSDDLFANNKIEIIKNIYKNEADIPWVFHDLHQLDKKDIKNPPVNQNSNKKTLIDEVSNMKVGKLKYDAPATSGLSFRRDFIAEIFPLPVSESIYISDHYIKFYCISKSKGLHLDSNLGSQVIHENNLYTGQKAVATKAKIFINTAYYLELANPEVRRFCNSIFEEGIICSHKSSIYNELEVLIQKYNSSMSFIENLNLRIRLMIKKMIGRY